MRQVTVFTRQIWNALHAFLNPTRVSESGCACPRLIMEWIQLCGFNLKCVCVYSCFVVCVCVCACECDCDVCVCVSERLVWAFYANYWWKCGVQFMWLHEYGLCLCAYVPYRRRWTRRRTGVCRAVCTGTGSRVRPRVAWRGPPGNSGVHTGGGARTAVSALEIHAHTGRVSEVTTHRKGRI